jgi:hypothetical protein
MNDAVQQRFIFNAALKDRLSHKPISTFPARHGVGSAQGPFWVIRAAFAIGRSLPTYPEQQTFLAFVGMFQRCQ